MTTIESVTAARPVPSMSIAPTMAMGRDCAQSGEANARQAIQAGKINNRSLVKNIPSSRFARFLLVQFDDFTYALDCHLANTKPRYASTQRRLPQSMAVGKAGTESLRSIGKTASPENNTGFGSSPAANRKLQCSVPLRSCRPRRAITVDPVVGCDTAIRIAPWSDRVSPKGLMALLAAGLRIENLALASSIQMLSGRAGLEIPYHRRSRCCRAHTSSPLSSLPSGNNRPNTTRLDPGLRGPRAKARS